MDPSGESDVLFCQTCQVLLFIWKFLSHKRLNLILVDTFYNILLESKLVRLVASWPFAFDDFNKQIFPKVQFAFQQNNILIMFTDSNSKGGF